VAASGEGQVGRSHPAADFLFSFEDENGTAGLGQRYSGRQAVRPRPDHHCIIFSQNSSFCISNLNVLSVITF
jgi:hypothetical protein